MSNPVNEEKKIWTVRAFETASRRGQVYATRYHVIAGSREEAIATVRATHERPELPETTGTRYTAACYDGTAQIVNSCHISRVMAEQSIRVDLA